MDLRIPVVESPGSLGGLVKAPAPKVMPDREGAGLALGYESVSSVPIASRLSVGSKATVKGKGKDVLLARGTNLTATGGTTRSVKLKLTAKGRKLFRDVVKKKTVKQHGKKRTEKKRIKGLKQLRSRILLDGKTAVFTVVKRNGKVR